MEGIIHIAGTMPRIGTTTVAMQLILFLQRLGYKAAYVEMNSQDYIWGVTALYADCIKDKLPGKVTYNGVELYSKERLPELISGGTHYDYIICDFGNIPAKSFDAQEFSDCSAMIIVAGVKPNEVFQTNQALKEPILSDAVYVFSFINKADEGDVLEMMQEKAAVTAFMPYAPDPFTEMKIPLDDDVFYPTDECFHPVMCSVSEVINGR